jgi:hypothetical protein
MQCCGCISIRSGVLTLILLNLIFSIISVALIITAQVQFGTSLSNSGVDGTTIALAYVNLAVNLVLSLTGLISVLQYRLGLYQVFAWLNVVLLLVSLGQCIYAAIRGSINISSWIGFLVSTYFTYIVWSYQKTLAWEAEQVQQSDAAQIA